MQVSEPSDDERGLRARLQAAEDALQAIRSGAVDALVVHGASGRQVFTRDGAAEPYRILIEQIYEGAATLSSAGDLLYVNRRMAELLGQPMERLVGTALLSHVVAEDRPAVQSLMLGAALGHADGEVRVRTGDQADVPLRLSFNALPASTGAALGLVASDLRAQRQAAAERERQGLQLEAALQQRAAALDAAEAAGRAKTAFLANISHEIRTPLNAVLGLLQLVQLEPLSQTQADRVAKIEQAGRHLLALIVDVLDLARVESGGMRLEPVALDVATLLAEVAALMAAPALVKGLSLVVEPRPLPPLVMADRTRLTQALLNLVGNAVKFTDQGCVTLRALAQPAGAGDVLLRFEVDDTGHGIHPSVAQRLFQSFEQGDASVNRRHGGSGLGLAITRRLAQLMGGHCGLEALPTGGSRFWFTAVVTCPALPAGDTAAGQGQPPPEGAGHPARLGGQKVLLVDDDPVNREVGLAMLQLLGLPAEAAVDGIDAVARMGDASPPALVLMDVHMPGMDGLEATRSIRALPRAGSVTIIGMTASAFTEDRERCLQAGMDDFLSKPIDVHVLRRALQHWLGPGQAAPARAVAAGHVNRS